MTATGSPHAWRRASSRGSCAGPAEFGTKRRSNGQARRGLAARRPGEFRNYVRPLLDTGRFALILNHMVKYNNQVLDRTFAALSDSTRRALLARLSDRDALS